MCLFSREKSNLPETYRNVLPERIDFQENHLKMSFKDMLHLNLLVCLVVKI